METRNKHKTRTQISSSNDDDYDYYDDDSAISKFCTTEKLVSEFCPQMFFASCDVQ
jgi:hypothetical protein